MRKRLQCSDFINLSLRPQSVWAKKSQDRLVPAIMGLEMVSKPDRQLASNRETARKSARDTTSELQSP